MFLKLPDWLQYEIQRRWERLAIRDRINANPRIVIGILCTSVVILLLVVINLLMPQKVRKIEDYKKAWFYDLNTGRLFVARSKLVPPIEAPSGPLPDGEPAGVKAYVFSYADQPNESNRFIGFLETSAPGAEKDKSETATSKRWGSGKLIRRVEDDQWVAADSKEGKVILEEVLVPSGSGHRPDYCTPK